MALADLNEATPDTTADDIKAYAEQVATEVESERKGEEKSDAQITSEHAGTPQPGDKTPNTPAEKNSGSESAVDDGEEAAEVEDQGEEAGESESPEWLTDDVKAEAAAYGIQESEIADFASREELDRALRLFDKSALEVGRKAMANQDEGGAAQPRNEKGQFGKKEPPPKAEETPAREGQFEITLDKDVYDEEIVGNLTRMRDHYDSRLAEVAERLQAYEERFAEADAIAKERHFDNLVDSLGHADLFGTTDKETAQEKQRREDLFVEVETYLRGREALGRPAELNDTILNRIARSLFAEELGKKDIKQRTRKISKQSNARQGGGATRPQDPREDPRDAADRLYRELQGV